MRRKLKAKKESLPEGLLAERGSKWIYPIYGRRPRQVAYLLKTALGICYLDGIDVPVDYAEAYRLLSVAAEGGASRAQLALGQMYAEGHGIPTDLAQARRLFELAAERGEFIAQIELGRMYSRGVGVPNNQKLALKWYSAAAAQESRVDDYEEVREAKAYLANAKS